MYTKLIPKLFLLMWLLAALPPAIAQVVPSAGEGGAIPIVTGGGYSNFSMDWGPGHRSSGITAWVDVYPFRGIIRDLGIEAEGRASRWGNPVPNLREDTAQMGGIYSLSRYSRIRPYGKFLMGIGSIDFPPFQNTPNYTHDTFTVTSTAGGADFQLYQHVWIRAEYQYQWWHHVFNDTLTPNGITVGAHWDFRKPSAP
jgi:hypothetical protein